MVGADGSEAAVEEPEQGWCGVGHGGEVRHRDKREEGREYECAERTGEQHASVAVPLFAWEITLAAYSALHGVRSIAHEGLV